MTTTSEEFRKQVLENGIEVVRAKGLVLKAQKITDHKSVQITIDVVDEEGTNLLRLCNQFLAEGDTLTILNLDEAFKVNLS